MLRKILIVFLMAFATLLPLEASAGAGTVDIIYTGALHGELEPCGCSPRNQSGGLTRLAAFVSSRKTGLSPYLLIDAGNSMAADTAQGRLKVEAMLGAFNIIGYDAVAFLGNDVSLPKAFLTPLIDTNKVPAVFEGGGRVVERGAFKINISAKGSAPRPGMLNILLTEMPVADAALLQGWQVIITSSGEVMDAPRLRPEAKGGVVVSAWPRGERLGILTIDVDKAGKLKAASHRWEALAMDAPEDARVRGVLQAYDDKVAGLLKDEERKASNAGPYLGVEACAACHQPFAEQWRATRHSGAFADLERAGKSKDPECVKCHTTGYELDGGFYSKTTTPGLVGVQCEVCHGPGRGHTADFSLPMRPVDESLCRTCHTKENSPEFDFKTYFEKIRHR